MSAITVLQKEALNERTSTANLLRKALLVAEKLEAGGEFGHWIQRELDGYGAEDKIPVYREVSGIPHAFNPYRGDEPIQFASAKQARLCSRMMFPTPIAQIEDMGSRKGGGTFVASYAPEMAQRLANALRPKGLRPSLHIESSQFRGIVEAVRNAILKWAIELEKKGVTGSGMTFSKKDKAAASKTTVNIETYIETMHQSQLQRGAIGSVQTLSVNDLDLEAVHGLVAQIESTIASGSAQLQAPMLAQLQADVATIKAQLQAPKPKHPIIRECLESIHRIAEQTGGALMASGILTAIHSVVGA